MALHSLYCADVPSRNCSLTHSLTHSLQQISFHLKQIALKSLLLKWKKTTEGCKFRISCNWLRRRLGLGQAVAPPTVHRHPCWIKAEVEVRRRITLHKVLWSLKKWVNEQCYNSELFKISFPSLPTLHHPLLNARLQCVHRNAFSPNVNACVPEHIAVVTERTFTVPTRVWPFISVQLTVHWQWW